MKKRNSKLFIIAAVLLLQIVACNQAYNSEGTYIPDTLKKAVITKQMPIEQKTTSVVQEYHKHNDDDIWLACVVYASTKTVTERNKIVKELL
jgi:lactam utilization protein B